MSRELDQLRHIIDSNDPFMSSGHQIIKSAGATRHANRLLKVPVWALDDNKIKELVLRCYPGPRGRRQAARMVRIIYMYYRVGMTASAIAEELGTTRETVKAVIIRAKRTVNRPAKPRGRVKLNAEPIGTAIGISGEDGHITL